MANASSGLSSPASTVALEDAAPAPLANAPPAVRGEVPPALVPHVRPGDQRLNPAQYLRILARRAYRPVLPEPVSAYATNMRRPEV